MDKIEINDNTAIMSLQSIRHFGVPAGNVYADESIRYAIKAIDTLAKVRDIIPQKNGESEESSFDSCDRCGALVDPCEDFEESDPFLCNGCAQGIVADLFAILENKP